MNLTAMDIAKLTRQPSPRTRAQLAAKIALEYRQGHFTVPEETIATDIFRLLLKAVETQIRQSLSEQLAHCPNTPHDIIVKLADDETEIAAPVLQYSAVLTDEDLIALVESTKAVMKLSAIARRQTLSEAVSGKLIATHEAEVLKELFHNDGAALAERTLLQSWDIIAADQSLLEALVHRGGLPLTVAEKMFHAVSSELKQQLATRYRFNTPFMHKATVDAREWAVLGLTPADTSSYASEDELVEDLVDDLHAKGRLTHSLLIRAICTGNLALFEAGIARLAGVPRVNARILLMDAGGLGLEAIYKAAALPEGFLPAVKVLLRLSLEETDYGHVRRADFRKRLVERVHIGGYHRSVENMQYLLAIIGGKIIATADAQ